MNVGEIAVALTLCVLACSPASLPREVAEANQQDLRTVIVTVPMTPDGPISPLPDIDASSTSSLCHSQLCGMDSYCACHPTGNGARCWSAPDDCEVDAICCAGRPGYCDGLRMDDCADVTVKARKARDGAKP